MCYNTVVFVPKPNQTISGASWQETNLKIAPEKNTKLQHKVWFSRNTPCQHLFWWQSWWPTFQPTDCLAVLYSTLSNFIQNGWKLVSRRGSQYITEREIWGCTVDLFKCTACVCVCVCAERIGGRGSVGRQSWEGHHCLITAMLVTSSWRWLCSLPLCLGVIQDSVLQKQTGHCSLLR